MVSKTGSHAQLVSSCGFISNHASLEQPLLKNHQNWRISRQLDCETGFPVFHLIDPWGLSVAVTEFIVEDIDHDFQEALLKLSTIEEQQQLVCYYLQKRLAQATSHRVHVERYGDKFVVRLGSYGLKGGGNERWKKVAATAFAGTLAVIGGCLSIFVRNGGATLIGGILMNGGVSAGGYAYSCKKYEVGEYLKQFAYGTMSGLFSVGIPILGNMATGAAIAPRICWQVLGSLYGNCASASVKRLLAKNETVDQNIGVQAHLGLVTGIVSGVIGSGADKIADVFRTLATSSLVKAVIHIAMKGVGGGFSAASIKVVTNHYEISREKKEEEKTWHDGVGKSFGIGFATSAGIAVVQTIYSSSSSNTLKDQAEQAKKDLQDLEKEKSTAVSEMKKHQKTLLDSQKDLAQKEEALKFLKEKQAPKELKQIQQKIDKAQILEQAKQQELFEAEQVVVQAQNVVAQNQKAIDALKAAEAKITQEVQDAQQKAQEAQAIYNHQEAKVDKEVRKMLKKGFVAKRVHGNYPNTPEKIKAVILRGEQIVWKKGPNSVFGTRETTKARPNYQALKDQAHQQIQAKTQEYQALSQSLSQEQLKLQEAQTSLNVHQQQVKQAQAQVEVVQKTQVEYSGQQASITQGVQAAQNEYKLSVKQAADDLIKALKGQQAQITVCNDLEKSIVIKADQLNVLHEEVQQALHNERHFSMLEGKDRIIRFLRDAYEKPSQLSTDNAGADRLQDRSKTLSSTNGEGSNVPQPVISSAENQLQFWQKILSTLKENPTVILLMILEPCLKRFIPEITAEKLDRIKNALTKISCLLNPLMRKELFTNESLAKMDTRKAREGVRITYDALSSLTKETLDLGTRFIQSFLSDSTQIAESKTIEKGLGKMLINDIMEARAFYREEKDKQLSPEKLAEKGKSLLQDVLLKNVNNLTKAVEILTKINSLKPLIDFLLGGLAKKSIAEVKDRDIDILDRFKFGFESCLNEVKSSLASGLVSVTAWGIKTTTSLWLEKFIDKFSLEPSLKEELKNDKGLIEGINALISIATEHLSTLEEFEKKYRKSIDLYSNFIQFLANTIVGDSIMTETELREQLSTKINVVTTHLLETDLPIFVDAVWAVKEDILNSVHESQQIQSVVNSSLPKSPFLVGNKTYKHSITRGDGACLLHAVLGTLQESEFCWKGNGKAARRQFETDFTACLETSPEVMMQFSVVMQKMISDRRVTEFVPYVKRLKNSNEAAQLLVENFEKNANLRESKITELRTHRSKALVALFCYVCNENSYIHDKFQLQNLLKQSADNLSPLQTEKLCLENSAKITSYFTQFPLRIEQWRTWNKHVCELEDLENRQNEELEKLCSEPALVQAYRQMILQDDHWFMSDEVKLIALVYGLNIKVLHQIPEKVDLAHDYNPKTKKERVIFLERDRQGRGKHYWRCEEMYTAVGLKM